jgi:ubiquitin-like 1-activating enzyme E1 A
MFATHSASCQQWGCEVSPVAAILGGIMGQEVVKAISKRDEPICNFFVFNGDDCAGTIAALQL